MFQSDTALVPYAGYQIAINQSNLNTGEGRAIFSSIKLGRLISVIGSSVYVVNIQYNHTYDRVTTYQKIYIGNINSATGPVYIAENNKPQIGISDGTSFYLYDPAVNSQLQQIPLNFVPGYLTFHDTYFILAAAHDSYNKGSANNTWRLSASNDGASWPSDAAHVGLLQTKPDNVKAVVRFPSKGNMIFVMGSNVTEAWFDTGGRLFPYQRNTQFNIDYGCLNPATVAYMDTYVVWLAKNESSGPIIMASDGGLPQKITSDGIDYLFATLQYPENSQGFLFRQDGHLFYHINFYKDNLSLFYDFNTQKFYHASDSNMNYFIASSIAFFGNQYYFVSRNNGNIYALDTTITTYEETTKGGVNQIKEIPRIRICSNIREANSNYMILNDICLTMESGTASYYQQYNGSGELLGPDSPISLPRVDLSLSVDGGMTFGSSFSQELPKIGKGKSRLYFWGLGAANDAVMQFRFWSIGRVVALDGIVSVR